MMPESEETSHADGPREVIMNILRSIVPKAITDVLNETILEFKNKIKLERLSNHVPEATQQISPKSYAEITRTHAGNLQNPTWFMVLMVLMVL